jgi:hypothetical protein
MPFLANIFRSFLMQNYLKLVPFKNVPQSHNRMLPAVSFDYYPSFETDKISNKPADLLLAPELEPIELPGFQALPQGPFRVGSCSFADPWQLQSG